MSLPGEYALLYVLAKEKDLVVLLVTVCRCDGCQDEHNEFPVLCIFACCFDRQNPRPKAFLTHRRRLDKIAWLQRL